MYDLVSLALFHAPLRCRIQQAPVLAIHVLCPYSFAKLAQIRLLDSVYAPVDKVDVLRVRRPKSTPSLGRNALLLSPLASACKAAMKLGTLCPTRNEDPCYYATHLEPRLFQCSLGVSSCY
jgi:hypothetical protein